ncbi:hypothetical protein D3C87_1531420 [compost metagenome]
MIITGANGCQDPLWRRPIDGGFQRDMGRHMNDLEPLGSQQHEGGLLAGQGSQHARMAIIMMAGQVKRFLVDRGGDNAADRPGFGVADGLFDEAEGRVASARVELAPGQRAAFDGQIDDEAIKVDGGAGGGNRQVERGAIAVDAGARTVGRAHVRQGTDCDLGSDARRVAHGDADNVAQLGSPSIHPLGRRTYLMARRK